MRHSLIDAIDTKLMLVILYMMEEPTNVSFWSETPLFISENLSMSNICYPSLCLLVDLTDQDMGQQKRHFSIFFFAKKQNKKNIKLEEP